MIQIKKFTETDFEFRELARIDNLVNHDSIHHPDDDKRQWKIRDKRGQKKAPSMFKKTIYVYYYIRTPSVKRL